ncbi:MAG: hypothetical protein ACRER4_02120 [Steroidobacteraceae bacterium]
MSALRKFSSQAEPRILDALQEIAAMEGRHFQAILGEAMHEYVARKRQQSPRKNVLAAFENSVREREELYRLLAK